MIFKFKLWKYETLNSKDSHKNSMKKFLQPQKLKHWRNTNAQSFEVSEDCKNKQWEYKVPSASAKNLQKTVNKNVYVFF